MFNGFHYEDFVFHSLEINKRKPCRSVIGENAWYFYSHSVFGPVPSFTLNVLHVICKGDITESTVYYVHC